MVGEPVILLDTQVLVWWVNDEQGKISRQARQALEQRGKRNELLVSSISFFEITTLEPVTDDIAERAGQFGDAFAGDRADRLIAATALLRAVPLVRCDEKLRGSGLLATIW